MGSKTILHAWVEEARAFLQLVGLGMEPVVKTPFLSAVRLHWIAARNNWGLHSPHFSSGRFGESWFGHSHGSCSSPCSFLIYRRSKDPESLVTLRPDKAVNPAWRGTETAVRIPFVPLTKYSHADPKISTMDECQKDEFSSPFPSHVWNNLLSFFFKSIQGSSQSQQLEPKAERARLSNVTPCRLNKTSSIYHLQTPPKINKQTQHHRYLEIWKILP